MSLLQRALDVAPHSLVSAAQSGGGIWGKNRVDYLEPTPVELYIAADQRASFSLDCPIETIRKGAGLERTRR